MLHQGIGYAAAHWSINHGYDQETTSVRRDQTPRTCSSKSRSEPISICGGRSAVVRIERF